MDGTALEPQQHRVQRVLLLGAASTSVGVHAALAPEHLREWPPLGAAFVAAAVLVSTVAVAFVLRPADRRPARLLGLLLGALIVGYASTRLAALPPLDPDQEPLDRLGVATCAVEAVGSTLALRLGRRPSTRRRLSLAYSRGGTR